MNGAPVIDAHHHIWDLSLRDQVWSEGTSLHRTFGLDELRPQLIRSGVDQTVVVQTLNVADETADLLEIAEDSDIVAGVVGWVGLASKSIADDLYSGRELPGGGYLVGIRHLVQDETDDQWLSRADVRRGLRCVADTGLVFDLLVRAPQMDASLAAIRALPDLRFVLDHCGKPPIQSGEFEPWVQWIKSIAQAENVVVKLSGLVTEADHTGWREHNLRPYFDTILDAFGPRRMIFGSDWPVCTLAATYDEVVRLAREFTSTLSSAEEDAIFGLTALQWYGLDT
jgi:L-fuconolactonase